MIFGLEKLQSPLEIFSNLLVYPYIFKSQLNVLSGLILLTIPLSIKNFKKILLVKTTNNGQSVNNYINSEITLNFLRIFSMNSSGVKLTKFSSI